MTGILEDRHLPQPRGLEYLAARQVALGLVEIVFPKQFHACVCMTRQVLNSADEHLQIQLQGKGDKFRVWLLGCTFPIYNEFLLLLWRLSLHNLRETLVLWKRHQSF